MVAKKDESGDELKFEKLDREKFDNTAAITLSPGPISDTGFLIMWEGCSGVATRKGYHAPWVQKDVESEHVRSGQVRLSKPWQLYLTGGVKKALAMKVPKA